MHLWLPQRVNGDGLHVGGLGLAIAYGSAVWSQRRRGSIAKQTQDEAVREKYRQEEIKEKRHES
jgi:hypothetical protein